MTTPNAKVWKHLQIIKEAVADLGSLTDEGQDLSIRVEAGSVLWILSELAQEALTPLKKDLRTRALEELLEQGAGDTGSPRGAVQPGPVEQPVELRLGQVDIFRVPAAGLPGRRLRAAGAASAGRPRPQPSSPHHRAVAVGVAVHSPGAERRPVGGRNPRPGGGRRAPCPVFSQSGPSGHGD